jgi:hypothetical protein
MKFCSLDSSDIGRENLVSGASSRIIAGLYYPSDSYREYYEAILK